MQNIPKLGFGTYGRTGSDGVRALETALEVGYRHMDTAQSYDTESEVGAAVRNSGLSSGAIWITTKIDASNYAPGKLIPSLEQSIERLGRIPNLTLLHWPSPKGEHVLGTYLDQILEAKTQGLTREIGVSNFPIALLEEAIRQAGSGQIYTNQIELNPFHNNAKLAKFCASVGVQVTCYLPIARGMLHESPTVTAIARHHNATPEQVALAWEMAKGYVAIPASSRADRIASNFAAINLSLSDTEIASLDTVSQTGRVIAPDWGPDWD